MQRIYLDHNATTRPHPAVIDEMVACLKDSFGNPSSIHAFGQDARRVLDRARQRVADLLGAEPEEVVFTSGGTEADNQAILAAARGLSSRGRHVVTSAVEHQAVLHPCRHLEELGHRVTYVPVDRDGLVAPEAVAAALQGDTVLVSLMLANNDVGTLQPVAEVAALARARGILVHSDAVQALGKVPVDVRALGVDLLSISAHKLQGPKGAGALFVRRGVTLPALLHGGHHERNRRAGTENVPAIAGFGRACALAREELSARSDRARRLRDRLEQGILGAVPLASRNGGGEGRLPNTSNLSFEGLDAETLLLNLDLLGVAVSTGAACSSESKRPSHVLMAMGRSAEEARSSLRFSVGEENDEGQIDRAIDAVKQVIDSLGPCTR